MEYLIVLAFLLLIMGYTSYASFYESQQAMEFASAQDAVDSLAKAADTVYSLGPCSKTYVFVTVPNSADSSSVGNHTLQLKVRVAGGTSDVFSNTLGNVTGHLPSVGGSYRLPVEMTCSGILLVGGGLAVAPSRIALNVTAGFPASSGMNLSNSRDTAVSGIIPSFSGSVASWSTVSDLPSSLNSGGAGTFSAVFNVPSGAYTGYYGGTLIITGPDAYAEVPVTLYVSGVMPITTTTMATTTTATTTTTTTTITTITTTTTTTLPTTCHDYCIVQSYSSGVCLENPGKCVSPDVYNPGGDILCPHTGGLNICCCTP